MKKIFTLLLLSLTLFGLKSNAQTSTVCNAAFDFSFVSPNTVKFTPAVTGDSPFVQHYWIFGDGSPVDQSIISTHTYASPGTYTVKHYLSRYSPNGVFVCADTLTKLVVIQQACNLTAYFTWHADSSNHLNIIFNNFSSPLSPSDSVSWTFGDGTGSSNINPSHIYTNAGTYTVCLRVKKNSTVAGTAPCVSEICKTVIVNQPCNIQAYFNWNTVASNPLAIAFQNLSAPLSNTDSIKWTFGDGTVSYDVNPIHTFLNAGTYTVCLRVKKLNNTAGTTPCVSEICKTVIVTQPCNLAANFSWSAVASSPLSIAFQNSSIPISSTDSVRWTFGDGTTSTAINPLHTYTNAGTYTVCLRIKKNSTISGSAPCVSEICKTIVVVQSCNLVAYFNWSNLSGNPLAVAFQNLSNPLSPTDSVRWTFGDGSSSTAINPTHTYANAGSYTVCLRVKKINNATGTAACVSEICKTVIVAVNQNCNLVPNFTWNNTAANPSTFAFQNTSTALSPTDSVKWTFGDGSSSMAFNPIHTYTNPGTYSVCLRIKKNSTVAGNVPCVREICKTIIVLATPACNLVAYFTWSNANSPNTFAFQNLSTPISSTDSIRWTFGDGTSSLSINSTHTYAQAGTYTVCLRIKKNSTVAGNVACVREICKVVTVLPQINCDSIHVSYTYQRDPFVANKIYFYANANYSIQDQTWTISKLSPSTQPPVILHQNNPAYVFNDTGYYRVCLKAVTLGGCIKEYCSIIRIEQVALLCNLQAYPNPTSSLINVSVQLLQPEMIHAFVYNSMNNLVREKHQQGTTGNNTVSLNVNDLVPGLYTIKVIYGNTICYARFNKL
jgi:PKD repeat protein